MANQFETAFIPQQPILKIEGAARPGEQVNFALILALIIFFVTIVLSISVYLYRAQIEKRVLEKSLILQEAEKDFNIDEIDTYKRIDSRLSLAKKLVDEHVISSVAFEILESSVAQNVGLTSLGFSTTPAGKLIDISGQAPSYAAVYFQAESWRAMSPKIQSVEVSGMTLEDKTGIVTFTMKLTIAPQYFESLQVLQTQSLESESAAVTESSESAESTEPANIPLP